MQQTAQSLFCNIVVMTQSFTNGSHNFYFFGTHKSCKVVAICVRVAIYLLILILQPNLNQQSSLKTSKTMHKTDYSRQISTSSVFKIWLCSGGNVLETHRLTNNFGESFQIFMCMVIIQRELQPAQCLSTSKHTEKYFNFARNSRPTIYFTTTYSELSK